MKRFVVLAFVVLAPFAHAQQRVAPSQSTDPFAPVPRIQYESAFTGYTPYAEQDLREWKKVNEEVAQAGGHTKMFRGSQAGHGGHKQGPTTPDTEKSAASHDQATGQPPAPGASQPPPASHKGH